MERKVLYADEGMIYTDGNTYGSIIYLAENMSEDSFYQIPLSEYEALQATEEVLNGV